MSSQTPDRVGGNRREKLKAVIARRKKEMQTEQTDSPSVPDPYANATASSKLVKGPTAVVYDEDKLLLHKCEWDRNYPEKPERLQAVVDRCRESGLFELCEVIPNPLRDDLQERILLKHEKGLPELLQRLCKLDTRKKMEQEAAQYDAIYINKHTYDCALAALNSVLNLTLAVAAKKYQNGMALIRPPGHHAMDNEYNGYCFFNNVAIAAESCIKDGLASRILIVDIDVHHGQGVQRMFYNRKDVLYFSIHRYEHGTFWPNLRESNFNYIGEGEGLGYNINVPLNATGLTDSDYLAIVFNILLPVAYEYDPDLIIVCAGYDASVGCPEGRMEVTPGFYAHLISLLSGLAQGRIVAVLEGGYFLPSLAEGAYMTLKSLLGGPCPPLPKIRDVHPSVIQTICNVRRTLLQRWKCFKICELKEDGTGKNDDDHQYQICYFGEPEKPPYSTRNCYPTNTDTEKEYYVKMVLTLKENYKAPMNLPVVYVYDDQMLLHRPKPGHIERPERPERISSIRYLLDDFGIRRRLKQVPIEIHDFEQYSPHTADHLCNINDKFQETKDIYVNEHTYNNVLLAVSGLLTVVDAVMMDKARSGVAVIRPPGHHAEIDKPSGFCFINNIAVAANYVQMKYNLERILIVDFDIHHGNGTQNMFYDSNKVMYISVHKHEHGKFFPPNSPRHYKYDGHGLGKGFNINIPFNKDKMGDTEYLAVFHSIILPAAYSFSPQIVLISAGFDAGINDPLGGYGLHPETFGHFIKMLKSLGEGKLILALEGGYNLTTTSLAMAICTKVLLGDPVMMPSGVHEKISEAAVDTIREVTGHLKQYYGVFNVNKKLGRELQLVRKVTQFDGSSYKRPMTSLIDADKVDDSAYIEAEMEKLNSSW